MKATPKYLIAIFLMLFTATVFAATPSPVEQVQKVTNKVLAQLKAKKVTMKTKPDIVYGIINKYLLPDVDTEMMSKSVLGRAGWGKANSSQRKKFVKLFTTLMTYTYSTALARYDDQTIKYYPIRGGYQGRTLISVNSEVIQPDGPPINLVYKLVLHGQQWKVYDISVEGVSLLESFRQQFASMLSNEGMDGLLKNLADHNEAVRKKNLEAANG